jgi:hypothetical protein
VSQRTVLAIIGAGALAVIALWWDTTPSASGLGGWLTGAGEILGLLAGYGVVVLVALMARLPPLERGIGTDQLAAGTSSVWSWRTACSSCGATRSRHTPA